eukprot:262809-Rhodomonas_salina.1
MSGAGRAAASDAGVARAGADRAGAEAEAERGEGEGGAERRGQGCRPRPSPRQGLPRPPFWLAHSCAVLYICRGVVHWCAERVSGVRVLSEREVTGQGRGRCWQWRRQ